MRGAINRLLIVDDESSVSNFLGLVAERLGYAVRKAADRPEFVSQLADFNPTALLLDLNLRDTKGTELLRHLAVQRSPAHVFLISGDNIRALVAAEHFGVSLGVRMAGILQKPLTLADLEEAFGRVFEMPAGLPVLATDSPTGVYRRENGNIVSDSLVQ